MELLDYESDDKPIDDSKKKSLLQVLKRKPRSKWSYLSGLCDDCGERILNCNCK